MTWKTVLFGHEYASIALQFAFLMIASLFSFRRVVHAAIGTFDAIEIRSYPRFVSGLLALDIAYLLVYQLLLRFAPPLASFGKFIAAVLISYPVAGIAFSGIGLFFDGGKAIRVVTGRYKPERYPKFFVDLTENAGRNSQLLPRAAVSAYLVLIFIAIVTAEFAKGK
jgi:hypothetical protein